MQTLLKEERQQYILDKLHRDGKVVAVDLCEALSVSEDTIRRDLRELADAGMIQRVHGGALLRSPIVSSFAVRQQQQPEIKATLARAAAGLVQNGQMVMLFGGTTTLQLARSLPYDLRATIVTNSPSVMLALTDYPNIDVIGLGGKLLKAELNTSGAQTVEDIQRYRFDLCVLGVCSLHPDIGISMLQLEETYVLRAAINCSADAVAVTPADRLDTAAPYVVGSLQLLTHLVTEASVPDSVLAPYQHLGITVIKAEGE